MEKVQKAFQYLEQLGEEALNEQDYIQAERLWVPLYQWAPQAPHVNSVLGHIYMRSGHSDKAIFHLERALEGDPDNYQILNNLGSAHLKQGNMEKAGACLEAAVDQKSDYGTALNNLGHVYRNAQNNEKALELYLRAYQKNPNDPSMLTNLANAYSATGRLEESEQVLLKGLEQFPDYVEFYNNLGNIYNKIGQPKRAMQQYDNMLAVRPNISAAANKVLVSLYDTDVDPVEQRIRAEESMRVLDEVERVNIPEYNHDKPRVGFISAHFGCHPVGYFSAGLFKGNNELDYYVYSKRNDGDELTAEIEPNVFYRKITGMDENHVCDLIQKDEIDILVDMGGLSGNNVIKLMKMKPAPIQVGWVGFAGTRGLEEIDYLISDWVHSPEGTDYHYTETLIRMPEDYVCYHPYVKPEIYRKNGPVTFIAPHNPCKMNETVLSLWGRILSQIPESRIVMAYKGLSSPRNQSRIYGILGSYGVESDRIEIHDHISNNDMMHMYNRADVMLDTWPYSSGLVCVESLYCGVPVIALPGEMYSGRHSLSHLKAVGLEELAAKDGRDYVEKAVARAKPLDTLTRKQIRSMVEDSPLFDWEQFAHDFNSEMWGIWND